MRFIITFLPPQFNMKREYLPIETLPAWQCLNGIVAKGVAFQKLGSSEYGTDKGSAIVATEAKSSDENDTTPEILLQIPSDLVLSLEAVHNYAKSDRYLRDVLEAIGDFGRVRAASPGALCTTYLQRKPN
jgi:hypothetical protein